MLVDTVSPCPPLMDRAQSQHYWLLPCLTTNREQSVLHLRLCREIWSKLGLCRTWNYHLIMRFYVLSLPSLTGLEVWRRCRKIWLPGVLTFTIVNNLNFEEGRVECSQWIRMIQREGGDATVCSIAFPTKEQRRYVRGELDWTWLKAENKLSGLDIGF